MWVVDWFLFDIFETLSLLAKFRKSAERTCATKREVFCQYGGQDYVVTMTGLGTCSISTANHSFFTSANYRNFSSRDWRQNFPIDETINQLQACTVYEALYIGPTTILNWLLWSVIRLGTNGDPRTHWLNCWLVVHVLSRSLIQAKCLVDFQLNDLSENLGGLSRSVLLLRTWLDLGNH